MQCRLKSLHLDKSILDSYVLHPIHNTRKINEDRFKNNLITDINFPIFNIEETFKEKKKKLNNIVIIEIACGLGDFLIQCAKNNPHISYLGIDYTFPVIERACLKAYNEGLKNLLFYCGDVEDFFTHDFKTIEVDSVMVNFPDPWPKKRHIKRRIIRNENIDNILNRIKPGGAFITATDVESLYNYHMEIFSSSTIISNQLSKYENHIPPTEDYLKKSNYELKGLKKKRKIFYTVHKKIS